MKDRSSRSHCLLSTFIFLLFSGQIDAQGNCLNAGFETGTMDGYETYYGFIDDFGNVMITTPGSPTDQFQIMNNQSEPLGYDPNAFLNCIDNKRLPIVPPGAGRYTLRLGDLDGGSKAARIVLEFEVTPEVSFFLLNYAVILEDPSHDYFEQPRFELYIRDVNGNPLSCGEYSVRAAAEIPGFESCDSDLRVRPWTSAGFELQSYLGQTIRIEIFTTDCSRGGHGGYAYLDASCKPLELILDGYCPGSETAKFIVTDGFEEYLWSTGDTTNEITITNPVAGSIYTVTLTSATGCSIVLRDTLPVIQELQLASFNQLNDTTICRGESVWVAPTGDNLPFIQSLDFGYSADSFLLTPVDTTTYSFISRDEYGCMTDTARITINVVSLDFLVDIQEPCGTDYNGEIHISDVNGDPPFIVALNGVEYTDKLNFEGLRPGTYTIQLTDGNGCRTSKSETLVARPYPEIDTVLVTHTSCNMDNGRIEIKPVGSIYPFQYSINGIDFKSSNLFTALAPGPYRVFLKTSYGCLDSLDVEIGSFSPPAIESVTIDSSYCGNANGQLAIHATGGSGTLSFSLDGIQFQASSGFAGLSSGPYTVYTRDAAGCVTSTQINLPAIQEPAILSIKAAPAYCNEDNGTAIIEVSGGRQPYMFELIGLGNNDFGVFDLLPDGSYMVRIKDALGCGDQQGFTIGRIPIPRIVAFHFIPQQCAGKFVAGRMVALNGVRPYEFSFDGGGSWQKDSVSYRIHEGDIQLSLVDVTGCRSDSIIHLINDITLYFPNIFSPNGDGVNDRFIAGISHDVNATISTYRIFDRWGAVQYEASGFSIANEDKWWNGLKKDGKPVEPGVYVYKIELSLEDGRTFCRLGDVTVAK